MSDAGLPDSSGDGFDSCADGVEQVRKLPCSMSPPALLQNKPGEGQHVGIEGTCVRHDAVRSGNRDLDLLAQIK